MIRATLLPAILLLAGCTGPQSMLEPGSAPARSMETLWWVLFWICAVVFVLVMVALLVGIRRGRRAPAGREYSERRTVVWMLVAGAAIPAVILVGIFVYTMVILDEVGPTESDGELTVVVTGKQFWWDVRYMLPGGDSVITANEIHIPVGRRVTLLLESDDVIHSLWVPKLHGKTDMIPGRTTEAWLVADEPGIYRGQCAEYCGVQHTWMALYVVAEPVEDFHAWLSQQRRPAAPLAPPPSPAEAGAANAAADSARVAAAVVPGTLLTPPPQEAEPMDHLGPPVSDSVRDAALARNARLREGLRVFLDPEHRCADCHTIRGVNDEDGGRGRMNAPGAPPGRTAEGPDLTHVASRLSIAAGLLPMNRGNMAGWIANPQVLKPGNLMPRIPLEPAEMNALLDYLMTLQ